MAAILRAVLPLLRLPLNLGDSSFALCVDSREDELAEVDGAVIGAAVDFHGGVRYAPEAVPVADAWIRGTVPAWLTALFGEGPGQLRTGGASDLAESCLAGLREGLGTGPESPAPALA